MPVSIENLKAHIDAFAARESITLGDSYHNCVRRFVEFVEGKQAEADAIDLLKSRGYSVIEPPSSTPSNP